MKENRGVVFSTWMGPLGVILFGNGLLVAHMLPPIAPSMNAADLAAFYKANATQIRIAAIMFFFGGSAFFAFWGAISSTLRRIEGRNSPYAYTQLAAGAIAAMGFSLAGALFAAGALRPDRPAEIVQAINDIAWLFLIAPAPIGMLQNLPIAMAILSDPNPTPLFPRWLGYLNLWVFILLIPGVLCVFFLTGPFAWNGLFAFWLPAGAFFIWLIAMTRALLKAAKREDV